MSSATRAALAAALDDAEAKDAQIARLERERERLEREMHELMAQLRDIRRSANRPPHPHCDPSEQMSPVQNFATGGMMPPQPADAPRCPTCGR